MSSYEEIDYSLRPAKSIERKMMCDAFRKLNAFARLESYRYIGFGSTYFSDFSLFHKSLGIHNMLSIEAEDNIDKQKRFTFNRPFKCIKIEFGHSNDILPSISWDTRSIIWLDYDGKISEEILADIQFICSSAAPGSLVAISVNVQPDHSDSNRRELLEERVGEENVPLELRSQEDEEINEVMAGWGTSRINRKIIDNKIKYVLKERNFGRDAGNKIQYKQIFNFQYADGAKMLTVGGILYDEGQSPRIAQCEFENLDFVRLGEDPCRIKVPILTYREIRYLDKMLPTFDDSELDSLLSEEDFYAPMRDIKKYRNVYRYFPNFAETDV